MATRRIAARSDAVVHLFRPNQEALRSPKKAVHIVGRIAH
jgi:hypothetical protein